MKVMVEQTEPLHHTIPVMAADKFRLITTLCRGEGEGEREGEREREREREKRSERVSESMLDT